MTYLVNKTKSRKKVLHDHSSLYLDLVQSHCPKKRPCPEKCSRLLTDIPSSPLGRWDCSNQESEGHLSSDILAWSQTLQRIEKNHVLR